jgi:sugar O-acyltransferase (sialic acid O-acetyltransferase NeuD family)
MNHQQRKCIILGGGGHAKVLIDAIQASKAADPIAVLDRDEALWGKDIFGVPILGSDEKISELIGNKADSFVVGIGSVGNPETRMKLYEMGLAAGLEPLTVIHPKAIVSPYAQIGKGSMLYAGSIVNPDAQIGKNVIINTGAIVEHDCVVGDHAHIATGARLAGTVTVGRGAHVGAGAVIRQNGVVGDFAVIGAGAVVTKPVAEGVTVVGNPARPLQKGAIQNKIATGLELEP